jgi:hypothetical protein
MKKYSTYLLLLVFALASGCAGRYPMLGNPGKTDTESLLRNWQDYEIYYAGVHAGQPSAVMFDPKDDGRAIVTERWFKTTNRELMEDMVDTIKREVPIGGLYPRLWGIYGPEGDLYGYMFTAWNDATMSMVAENRLFVNDIPVPPYQAADGVGFGADMGPRSR